MEIADREGHIDILVNNAALYRGMILAPADELPIEEWQRHLDVNLSGTFYMCRAVMPAMKEQRSGKIVNQSSIGAFIHGANSIHYAVTKAAVLTLTQCLATELGQYNVNVNAIAPGVINTPATMERPRPRSGDLLDSTKINRIGTPDDLRGALEFLCTDASDYMTGQVLVIDGGVCMIS